MFDIQIGTIIPMDHALEMFPVLNPMGYECYEISCPDNIPLLNLEEWMK